MSREKDLEDKEITIHTNFKFKDYEGVSEEDIRFPSFKTIVRREFLKMENKINKLELEVESLKKIIGVEK